MDTAVEVSSPPIRVLVPVDFDNPSRYALAVARELAARIDASVVIAHVFHSRFHVLGKADPSGLQAARQKLLDFVTAEAAATGQRADASAIEMVLRQGDPASRILELIAELHPALVVVGTHARRGIARLVLGSVAEKVVRESP